MIMDKEVREQMSIANATGMSADGFIISAGDHPLPEVYNDEESEVVDGLANVYFALKDLGEVASATSAEAKDFSCLMGKLTSAETEEDYQLIASCYGSLAGLEGVRKFIEFRMRKLKAAKAM